MENERAEWMYLSLAKKNCFMCFCFVLISCRNMSQTSENERV